MLILPERGQPRGRVLLPQRASEWRQPSQRATTFGIENQTRWRLTARLHDGHIAWKGWFDDRDDCDAFLFALARHVLLGEVMPREIIRFPDPREGWPLWSPDLTDADVLYAVDTVAFKTSPTGSNQTYTTPSDWDNAHNFVETIGGGGALTSSFSVTTGGSGGGAYSKSTNLSPGASTTFQIGAGGSAADGGDSWFGGTTLAGSTVGSKGGGRCNASSTGASGGASASGVGSTKYSGGNGGSITQTNTCGGGGGAAGPNGAGGNGGTGSTTGPNEGDGGGGGNGGGSNGGNGTSTTGGDGGNNSGGTGHGVGASSGTNATAGTSGGGGGGGTSSQNSALGSTGTEWDSTHGSGGGGGGRALANAKVYGGGSGGDATSASSKVGGAGILVITYTPLPASIKMRKTLSVLGTRTGSRQVRAGDKSC